MVENDFEVMSDKIFQRGRVTEKILNFLNTLKNSNKRFIIWIFFYFISLENQGASNSRNFN